MPTVHTAGADPRQPTAAPRPQPVPAPPRVAGWYWLVAALGWVALGLAVDLGNAWVVGAATLVFGAANAPVARRALDGWYRSAGQRARGHLPTALYGHLVAGGLLTILLGVGAAALGAPAPVTLASLVVAVLLLVGGPRVTV